jgi:hypothetical protein
MTNRVVLDVIYESEKGCLDVIIRKYEDLDVNNPHSHSLNLGTVFKECYVAKEGKIILDKIIPSKLLSSAQYIPIDNEQKNFNDYYFEE